MNRLNCELFRGQPVLSCSDGFNIAINTQFIPENNNNNYATPAHVQVIERVVYDGTNDRIQQVEVITVADGHTANPAADNNNHHHHAKKSISMTIPDGVTPGMTIPIETPEGKQITVTIPRLLLLLLLLFYYFVNYDLLLFVFSYYYIHLLLHYINLL